MRDPLRKQVLKLLMPIDSPLICTTQLSLARLGGVAGGAQACWSSKSADYPLRQCLHSQLPFWGNACMDEMSLASSRADIAPKLLMLEDNNYEWAALSRYMSLEIPYLCEKIA